MSPYPMSVGIAGMLCAVVGMGAVSAAILLTQDFSFGDYLSDMGRKDESTAPIFNNGLMASGLLGSYFAIGLLKTLANIVGRIGSTLANIFGRIGSLFLLIASIGLFGVGYFPLGVDDDSHITASYVFFIFLALALLALGISFMIMRRRALGVETLLACVISLSVGVILLLEHQKSIVPPFFPVGLAEFIPALTGSAWIFFIALTTMIRNKS